MLIANASSSVRLPLDDVVNMVESCESPQLLNSLLKFLLTPSFLNSLGRLFEYRISIGRTSFRSPLDVVANISIPFIFIVHRITFFFQ